jgi:hypothetical protein
MNAWNWNKVRDQRYSLVISMRSLIEQQWRRLEWPVIILILLPFLMFGRSLRPDRVFSAADILFLFYPWRALKPGAVPHNSLLSDRTFVFEPWLIYASRAIRSGRFPLWNPHAYGGAPFLGNFQSALLFPFTAIAYVLPLHMALGMEAILKIGTAGLSMYWMLRVLALQPLAATAGALAFMFNGFIIAWLGWPVTNVAIWLPLLVGLTERLRQSGTLRYTGWLALVIGVQFLGGHPETSFFLVVMTTSYALFRARGSGARRFIIQFAGAGVIGGLIAAVQLFPFYHYLTHSSDFFYRRQNHLVMALPLRAVIVLLIPNYFGSPASHNFWGPWNYNEISGSVGVLPWILMPCALLGGSKRRETKFFLGAAILIGLVVYDVRPFPWLLATLPGFAVAANERLLLLLAFSLAVLCGIGMEILIKPRPDGRLRIVTGVKLLFLLLVIIVGGYLIADHKIILRQHLTAYVAVQSGAFLLPLTAGALVSIYALRRGACSTTFGICLLAIELLSILSFAPSYNPIIKTKALYPTTPALRYLQRDHSLFRVLLPIPNVGAVYGLSDIVGYDAMTPRYLEQLVDATDSIGLMGVGPLQFTDALSSQVTDLVNIKYVLLPPAAPGPGPKFQLVYDGADGRIYRNSNVFPRAFLVSTSRACLQDASALAMIRSGKVDLRRQVVIAGCPHVIPDSSPVGTVSVEHYGPQRITMRASVRSPAYLVLTDTYDREWRVWVDGREVPLLRADYAFRAVALGPGSHKVKFLYHPLIVIFGLVLSIIALLGSVSLILAPIRRPRMISRA